MAVVGSLQEFSAQTCSICKQCFDDPVTLDCGHNFCQACLPSLPHWGEPNRDLSCLLCNETVHQRNFKPNQQLGNLAQLFRKLQEGAKRDAERRQVSKSQQDPPRLFCKEDRAPIGTGCKSNKEDKIHGVVPAEVAAQGSKVTQAASPNINATKTPVLGSPTTNEEQETMCSICKEYLRDPVTLDCGHNFCRGCITKYCNIWENQDGGVLECPLCKSQIQKWNFRPNLQLAEIIENLLPLKSYKERSQTQLKSWEKEKQNLVDQKQSEEEEKQKCLKQLNAEKQKIKDAFEQMQNSLKEKESSWLACLRNLEKEIKKEVAENGNRLSEDISYLTNLIAELEKKCEQPPLLFLQDIESTLLRYEEKRAEHSAALSTWLEERLKISCQKNSALVNAMVKCADSLEEALKKEGLNKCHTTAPLEQKLEKVSVTLDPQTAHPLLTLSADLKSVKVGEVPDDEAEDMDGLPYVLGREKFTSGRHWWEVELDLNAEDEEYMDKECLWIIGAAQESFERNRGFDLSPKAMVWAVGVSPFSKKLTAFTSRKPTHLSLAHQVRKIRVSLDYKAGRVEFFDADTNALIFTFSAASFTGEAIRPFFCLGGEGLELKCGN